MEKFTKTIRWIIWGALFQAILMYAVLVPIMGPDDPAEEIEKGNLVNIFGGVGLALFAIGQGIGYFVNHLRTPEGRPKVFEHIDVAFILALAFSEIPAILGLAIGLMGGSLPQYALLYLLSLVGMILLRPPAFYRVADKQGEKV
ncbi:MAG: hypothetical protein AAF491_01925 [Verrucomicrobiota bacterium]